MYGAQAVFWSRPQNYSINFFSNKTQTGATAAITLAKYPDGYGLFWSVQVNTKAKLPPGFSAMVFFSPQWFAKNTTSPANGTFTHFVCDWTQEQDDNGNWTIFDNDTYVLGGAWSGLDLNTQINAKWDLFNSFMEMELHDDFWYPDFTWQQVYANN